MGRLEHELGIRSTYYFRCVKASWNEDVMRQIADMGHEIGYHYEDLSLTGGNNQKAITHFEKQLARMREISPVKTICMHGSPMSRYDNRELWRSTLSTRPSMPNPHPPAHHSQPSVHGDHQPKPHYHDYDIIGEPYFDIDFSKVFYLTEIPPQWPCALSRNPSPAGAWMCFTA